MAEVIFHYKGGQTIIQCNYEEKMKDICKKVGIKIEKDINDLIFLYGGSQLDQVLNLNEQMTFDDKQNNKMNVIIYDRNEPKANTNISTNSTCISTTSTNIGTNIYSNSTNISTNSIYVNTNTFTNIDTNVKSKNVICPLCSEICRISIIDYKVILYECKNGHMTNNLFLDDFNEKQMINESDIKCSCCERNKTTSYNKEFFKCLECQQLLCKGCQINHNKEHEKQIINYDKIFFVCNKHNDSYMSYCVDCKLNLCMYCEEHQNHHVVNFSSIVPDNKKDEEIKELRKNIDSINNMIDDVIKKLNYVKEKMEIFYNINSEILNNFYENRINKSYQTFCNVNEITENIKRSKINDIINETNIGNKISSLLNIYDELITKDNNHGEKEIEKNKEKKEKKIEEKNIEEKVNKEIVVEEKSNKEKINVNVNKDKVNKEKNNKSNLKKSTNNAFNTNNELKKASTIKDEEKRKNENRRKTLLASAKIIDSNDKPVITNRRDSATKRCYNTKKKEKENKATARKEKEKETKQKNIKKNEKIDSNNNRTERQIKKDETKIEEKKIKKRDNNELILKYKITENELVIFGKTFVENNKSECKIEIDGEIFELREKITTTERMKNKGIETIKLRGDYVKDMSYMFYKCKRLLSIEEESYWDTSKVTNMKYMFYGCSDLRELSCISIWNTSSVENMSYIFADCVSLENMADISSWDISKVTELNNMFENCISLKALPDISKWDTKNVITMREMFSSCQKIKEIANITEWDISKVENMNNMFKHCTDLRKFPSLEDWNISHVKCKLNMFECCNSLFIPSKFYLINGLVKKNIDL